MSFNNTNLPNEFWNVSNKMRTDQFYAPDQFKDVNGDYEFDHMYQFLEVLDKLESSKSSLLKEEEKEEHKEEEKYQQQKQNNEITKLFIQCINFCALEITKEIVNKFMNKGLDINVRSNSYSNDLSNYVTALQCVCEFRIDAAIEALLSCGSIIQKDCFAHILTGHNPYYINNWKQCESTVRILYPYLTKETFIIPLWVFKEFCNHYIENSNYLKQVFKKCIFLSL